MKALKRKDVSLDAKREKRNNIVMRGGMGRNTGGHYRSADGIGEY